MIVGLAALALLGVVAVHGDRELQRQLDALDTVDTIELVYAPPTSFLQLVSLGYQHTLADVLWFRTINYFGAHYRGDRVYPFLAEMCDRVTDLDPTAEHVYRFAAFILPWEAMQVDESITLLEKGMRNLPESWELPYFLGMNYYFFKDDIPNAARAVRHAIGLPGAHPIVVTLSGMLEGAEKGPQQAINFLEAQLQETRSPEVREPLERRIREFILTRDIDALDAAVNTFTMRLGHPPTALQDLVTEGVLAALPIEPFGGRYVLDPGTGKVSTDSGNKPARLGSSELRETILKRGRVAR